MADWEIGKGRGAAPRPGRGGALTRPGERSVQARSAKPSTATENGEQNALAGDGRSGVPGLFGFIAAKGGGPGCNLWGSSKLLNL